MLRGEGKLSEVNDVLQIGQGITDKAGVKREDKLSVSAGYDGC